ncbi:MAG: hypothetical protein KR126chlam1_01367 [Chlamydiae bacterium]|nr:hypothetical protein [Chlamydiota bacterium]
MQVLAAAVLIETDWNLESGWSQTQDVKALKFVAGLLAVLTILGLFTWLRCITARQVSLSPESDTPSCALFRRCFSSEGIRGLGIGRLEFRVQA